ncbi:hypothetical protein MHU86_20824 [Fragilaria crotonensis]|nr:hypothetical protein MHU86_20824 [Fragilaria crotonensis]
MAPSARRNWSDVRTRSRIENAVNPNFNDDISDNGLDIGNMSCGIRWKRTMTEIFIKTGREIEIPYVEFPPTPPYTDKTPADTTYESADMLTTTIPAQPQTTSAFRRTPRSTVTQTSSTRKLPDSQSHFHNFEQKACSF